MEKIYIVFLGVVLEDVGGEYNHNHETIEKVFNTEAQAMAYLQKHDRINFDYYEIDYYVTRCVDKYDYEYLTIREFEVEKEEA